MSYTVKTTEGATVEIVDQGFRGEVKVMTDTEGNQWQAATRGDQSLVEPYAGATAIRQEPPVDPEAVPAEEAEEVKGAAGSKALDEEALED